MILPPSVDHAVSSEAPRLGLYVHVPFCKTRCAFCAFYLQIHRPDRVNAFLDAFELELRWYAERNVLHGRPIQSVYFGGGTPTTLTPDQLERMVACIQRLLRIVPETEFTIEGHPETVSPELVRRLLAMGFTRLSLGAESMAQEELIRVGRPTSTRAIVDAVAMARAEGLTNLNLDLMYGLPGQTVASWTATLHEIVALAPSHLSCYALTIEDGTALADDIARRTSAQPSETFQTACELHAEAVLSSYGYRRYELSNYARPGWECRHNLLYWQNGSYLGCGPSAESYLDGIRFGNVANLDRYADALHRGKPLLAHQDVLTVEAQQREAVVFGLRQVVGVERQVVETLTHDPLWRVRLDALIREDLLEFTPDRLRLTARGRQLADSVALQLI